MISHSNTPRIDHGVTHNKPVSIKHDIWDHKNKGARDMHFSVELGIVIEGSMIRKQKDWSGTFTAGDLWINGIWEPHESEITKAPLHLVMFHIYPAYLSQLVMPEMPNQNWLAPFITPPENRPHGALFTAINTINYAKRMIDLCLNNTPINMLKQRLLFLELLVDICHNWQQSKNISYTDSSIIQKLNVAIETVLNNSQYQSLQEIAQLVGLDRNQFSRSFTALTGMRFHDFSLSHRIQGAAYDLRFTTSPLKVIAGDWGFSDKSHLHKNFTKIFKKTPLQYRKDHYKSKLS